MMCMCIVYPAACVLQNQLEALRSDVSRLTEERNCLLADLSLLRKTCAGCRQCAIQSADCRLSVVRDFLSSVVVNQ